MVAATNIQTLRYRDVPLCVACLGCGHRILLEADHILSFAMDLDGMASIKTVERRLRCRQCKAKDLRTIVPTTRREAKRFIEQGRT